MTMPLASSSSSDQRFGDVLDRAGYELRRIVARRRALHLRQHGLKSSLVLSSNEIFRLSKKLISKIDLNVYISSGLALLKDVETSR